jgi:hypothetical protein
MRDEGVRTLARRGMVTGVTPTFIFLMVALKLPIFGLLYIVWWAVHSPPDPEPVADEGGGTKKPLAPHPRSPHPRARLPRPPRRGPHGAPALPAPPRVRTVVARARRVEH